jgi:hypothetical protein
MPAWSVHGDRDQTPATNLAVRSKQHGSQQSDRSDRQFHRRLGGCSRNALAGAFKSLHGISDLEIIQYTARVVENEIIEYRALVRLAFVVD